MKNGQKAQVRSWGGWRSVGCGLLAMAFCAEAFAAAPAPKPKPKPAPSEALPPCDPKARAEIVVLNDILQPKERVVPVGPNNFGDPGGAAIGMNNFIKNSGDEPANIRYLWRVKKVGDGWIELDWMGTPHWKTWGDGFLSGATARFYRLVDAEGKSLPRVPDKNPETSYIDIAKAHHVMPLGRARVLPTGSSGHAKGGWIANDNEQRVYLEAKGPALEVDDYVIFEKSFTEIDVATIDPSKEVTEVGYSWRQAATRGADASAKLRFSLVAHPKPATEIKYERKSTTNRDLRHYVVGEKENKYELLITPKIDMVVRQAAQDFVKEYGF